MSGPTAFDAMCDTGDPASFPLGSRVLLPDIEDFHFFHGQRGEVVRHAGRAYLGVIVRLDRPFRCDHGHFQHVIEEFNFSAASLRLEATR